jgi:hypothetical protein
MLGALALVGTSGCIIESNNSSCVGSSGVQTDWIILDAAGNQLTCAAAGAAAVNLYVDGAVTTANCSDGSIGAGVGPGLHTVQLNLTDANGTILSSVSPMQVDVASCGVTTLPMVQFGVNVCGPGAVHASWILTANGATVSCLPGDQVSITVDGHDTTFPCSAMSGTSSSVTGGASHQVSLTLTDSTGAVISMTQTMSLAVACSTTQDIGQVELQTQ